MDPVENALSGFLDRIQAFLSLFWASLGERLGNLWLRIQTFFDLFFDELLGRTQGIGSALSQSSETTREIWPLFFDLVWDDLQAFDEQLREWSIPFFDFLWQTFDDLWPGFDQIWGNIVETFQSGDAAAYTSAIIKILIGFFLARLARGTVTRTFGTRMTRQQLMVVRRLVSYSIIALFGISALRDLDVQLDVLLGAAGILTVAIGFASQTSASNLISGLFLIAERAVEVGDIIDVEGTVGEVLSIDLLSSRIRTFDNLLVRIPNETMVKAKITNLTRLPIRRADIQIGVAYKEDLNKVREVLNGLANKNPLCLQEPAPLIIFLGYGASSIDLQFSVWAVQANWLELRNSLQQEIKEAFDANGIEIPFPHMTLYTGSVTDPFPIQNVGRASEQAAQEADIIVPKNADIISKGEEATFSDHLGASRPEMSPAAVAPTPASAPSTPAQSPRQPMKVTPEPPPNKTPDDETEVIEEDDTGRKRERPLIVDASAQGETDVSAATGTELSSNEDAGEVSESR